MARLQKVDRVVGRKIEILRAGGDIASADFMVQYAYYSAMGNVLCPACKLWNTGVGANVMREAVSLMGGYGITEDCPGFLGQKWMDSQLEATYEGPEVVQRRQISVTMSNPIFREQLIAWSRELKTSLPAVSTALDLWMWTADTLGDLKDADGKKLMQSQRHGVLFPLVDALCWLLATRSFAADIRELATKGPDHPVIGPETEGYVNTFTDLVTLQSARAAGEAVRICGELLFGYQAVLDDTVIAQFRVRRDAAETALYGTRLAKDRAAKAISQLMIPEALDYPQA